MEKKFIMLGDFIICGLFPRSYREVGTIVVSRGIFHEVICHELFFVAQSTFSKNFDVIKSVFLM